MSLDPNWDPSGGWDGGLHELLSEVDVLVPNEAEACRIAGLSDVEAAAARLAAKGPQVAVKLGPAGALLVPAGGGSAVRGEPPRGLPEPVDAIGAGDAFDAGLLAGLLGGKPPADALALACACGALSLRAAGGTAAQPTLDEAMRSRCGGG